MGNTLKVIIDVEYILPSFDGWREDPEFEDCYNIQNLIPEQLNVKNPGLYKGGVIHKTKNCSCGTYNNYRNIIAGFVGKTNELIWNNPDQNIPFIKFINYYDCEGGFDQDSCRELYNDFEKYKDMAINHEQIFFTEFYNSMLFCFKLAVEKEGMVIIS